MADIFDDDVGENGLARKDRRDVVVARDVGGGDDGGDARKRLGLPGGGPAAVITDRAILRPFGPDHELHLASVHPGHTVEEIVENTGWELKSIPDLGETTAPSADEMAALHRIDKEGFWRS